MRFDNLEVRSSGPQTGLSAFNGKDYLGTYRSLHEFMLDLIYRFSVENIDEIIKKFNLNANQYTIIPYKYRGVCSEIFWPMDHTPFRYVYYCNTLSDLFEKFEFHERRAKEYEKHFYYGPQGSGIHIFNKEKMKYEFWVGGKDIKTVCDVMKQVKEKGLTIPSCLQEEFDQLKTFDVFISHKSEDYKIAKRVYDVLSKKGIKIFLSEITLPAIANTDYTAEISNALDLSKHLIVIADSINKISSGWVKYEWTAFLNEKLSGRKEGNILTVVTDNISIDELPFTLRQFEVISINSISQIEDWFSDHKIC